MYKYGIRNGPLQAKKVVSEFANQFFQIYSQLNAGKVWDNLGQEIESLGLTDAAKMSCKEFYQSKGISELYIDQVMGSILRNIYLSNVDHVHSVGCSVALYAASFDTFSIKGGNYKLFERMLQGHTVHLDAKVKQITNLDNSIRVEAIVGGKSMISDFDDVVLAAPLQHSGIELVGFKNNHWSQKVDYLKLYVTIVKGQLDAGYFQSDSELEIPTGIFTPADSSSPFHCLSIHKYLNSTHTISKIFSNHELSDNELLKFYVSVENVKRHEWNHPGSYPDLIPRQDWNYTVNDGHLWYLNGFEPFISTMETSGLSAMNVAKHLTSN